MENLQQTLANKTLNEELWVFLSPFGCLSVKDVYLRDEICATTVQSERIGHSQPWPLLEMSHLEFRKLRWDQQDFWFGTVDGDVFFS
jgi:hypothetical protein